MSLRRDVHSAFDNIAPPLGGMPERVVQTALAQNSGRRRKERMTLRMTAPLALVAAVLLIAVGVAAFMNWNALRNASPAGQSNLTILQQLEARPIQLPAVTAGQSCPQHLGYNTHGFNYGSGPVYADGGPQVNSPWGYYYDVRYYTDPHLSGPVLVRGRDLESDRRVVFVGNNAAGPVVGKDSTQTPSDQHVELVLDPRHPPATVYGFGAFAVRQGLSKGWVGCFGLQMDGPGFTETFMGYFPPYVQ